MSASSTGHASGSSNKRQRQEAEVSPEPPRKRQAGDVSDTALNSSISGLYAGVGRLSLPFEEHKHLLLMLDSVDDFGTLAQAMTKARGSNDTFSRLLAEQQHTTRERLVGVEASPNFADKAEQIGALKIQLEGLD